MIYESDITLGFQHTKREEVWVEPKNHTIQTPLQKVWLEDWTNRMKLVVIYFALRKVGDQ